MGRYRASGHPGGDIGKRVLEGIGLRCGVGRALQVRGKEHGRNMKAVMGLGLRMTQADLYRASCRGNSHPWQRGLLFSLWVSRTRRKTVLSHFCMHSLGLARSF